MLNCGRRRRGRVWDAMRRGGGGIAAPGRGREGEKLTTQKRRNEGTKKDARDFDAKSQRAQRNAKEGKETQGKEREGKEQQVGKLISVLRVSVSPCLRAFVSSWWAFGLLSFSIPFSPPPRPCGEAAHPPARSASPIQHSEFPIQNSPAGSSCTSVLRGDDDLRIRNDCPGGWWLGP